MIFVMGLISIVVTAILVRPIMRRGASVIVRDPLADAVGEYERRLSDLDRDVAKGTISADDAELARAEIGRQLLRERKALEKQDGHVQSTRAETPSPQSAPSRRFDLIMLVLIASIPIGAGLVYWQLGSPGFVDQPLSKRLAQAAQNQQATTSDGAQQPPAATAQPTPQERNAQLRAFIAQLEASIADNPDDIQGWGLLARSYEALEEFDQAGKAWRGLLGADPDNRDGLWFAGVNAVKREMPEQARPLWTALREQYEAGSQDYELISQALATLDAPDQ